MMQKDINDKIEKALNSLDGMHSAEPKPFLLTRIKAAMTSKEKQSVWSRVAAFIQRPVVAAVAVIVLVLINFAILNGGFSVSNNNNNLSKRNISAADDFAINVSAVYDIENQEP